MYHRFEHYPAVQAFLAENENARLVGWPCGTHQVFMVFIPNQQQHR